jgi:hypothetical protein
MIEMVDRCRCGANWIAGLAFCVTCGDRRPELVGAVAARGGAARPTRHQAPVGYPSLPSARQYPAAPQYPVVHRQQPYPAAPRAQARPHSSAPWILGGAAIVVVAVVSALILLMLRPAADSTTTAQQPTTVVVPSTTTVTAAPTSNVSSSSTTSSTEQLTDQVDTDRAAVEGLTGYWVPQLSSKRVGTVADGITYDADAILGHYRGLAAQYPGAKLLYSGDWPVFNGADYWVVVVAQPFSTPAAANAWCSSHGLSRDDCFAKQLSHSGGPAGTTVQR